MQDLSEIIGYSSGSIFRFKRKNLTIIEIKEETFKEFSKTLSNLNKKNEQQARKLLTDYLKATNLSLHIYKKMEHNLWETFKYLNELPIIKVDIGQDIFTSPLERQYLEYDEKFSKDIQNKVAEIKEVLRELLGANNYSPLLFDLIKIIETEKKYLQDLLHPSNTDFIRLDEEEKELERMFSIEKDLSKRLNSLARQLNSTSKNLGENLENFGKSFLSMFNELKRSYNENPGMGNKLLALSKYANKHAGLIAFTVVALSATIFIGPYVGIAPEVIVLVTHTFHNVATWGEGIQSIEEGKKFYTNIKEWISKTHNNKISDGEILKAYSI